MTIMLVSTTKASKLPEANQFAEWFLDILFYIKHETILCMLVLGQLKFGYDCDILLHHIL